jgi:hypothetical protein
MEEKRLTRKASSHNSITAKIKEILSNKTSDVWRLLSETDSFLSRTGEYSHYEHQMRGLRARLAAAGKMHRDKIKEIHSELVSIRKHLRLSGYDLSLGKYRLVFDGFRHDDSIREGFRRLVFFICDDFFLWLTGDANHIDLAETLEQQITRHSAASGKRIVIKGKHYLWYLRTRDELILSGADTETKDDYERLKAYGEVSSLLFLSRLKNLN